MGKGQTQRLRVKRALEAARGNLHRAARGKSIPTKLPEAPKPQDTAQLPKSLRRIMEVQAAERQQQQKPGDQPQTVGTSGQQQPQQRRQQPAGSAAGRSAEPEQPSTSGRQEAKPAPRGGPPTNPAKVIMSNPFEQFGVKKLKSSKKEYLRSKQLKKKQGNRGTGGAPVVEKELKLRDKVAFGEVVHAPLEMQLKRKHWSKQQEGKERTAADRCKDIFLKQMREAQQRMADAGEGVHEEWGAAGAGPLRKRAKRQHADAARAQEDKEALRQQVVDAYRSQKKLANQQAAGHATNSSLAKLVKGAKGAIRAAAIH